VAGSRLGPQCVDSVPLSAGSTQRALEADVAGVISDDASVDELVERSGT
jgi:hypothetical protein